ncbi:MAG: DUF262 domain-containing HNH endonuclease family protein [Hyphomonas sp.]|nr:DUF262 domain-containing protein [Hyphomonas sp.]MCB9961021.1 DUF262 domain-containing protein [Hyphomonas sp.]MCB9970312.1 DUF262 domain-containing protein [Hyphomonas sp.]
MQTVAGFTIPLKEFFVAGMFEPADIQREYRWQRGQVDQLLSDLLAAADIRPDLGTFDDDAADSAGADDAPGDGLGDEAALVEVVSQQAPLYLLGPVVTAMHDSMRWQVYDGLQRMTTLTLLFQVLLKRLGEGRLQTQVSDAIADRKGERRLVAPKWGQWLDMGLHDGLSSEAALPDTAQVLVDAGARLGERLDELTDEQVDAFTDYLMNRVYFAVIHVSDRRVARQIFVTMNDRGQPLDSAEIFKGQLADLAGEGRAGEAILARWDTLRTETPDMVAFVDALSTIAGSVNNVTQGAVSLIDGLRTYIEGGGQADRENRLDKWLSLTEWRAKAWAMLHDPVVLSGDQPWQRGLFCLSIHERGPDDCDWRPLAVELVRVALMREDRGRRGDHYGELGSRVWGLWRRITLLRMADSPTDFVRSGVHRTIGEVNRQYMRGGRLAGYNSTFPLPYDLENRLVRVFDHGSHFPIVNRTLLKCLEVLRAGDGPLAHLARALSHDDTRLSPEHIMPKSVRSGSYWKRQFPDEAERNRLLNRPGNFVLLPHVINRELGSKQFPDKRRILSAFEELEAFSLVRDILVHEDWTPEVIRERSDALKAEVLAAFADELGSAKRQARRTKRPSRVTVPA